MDQNNSPLDNIPIGSVVQVMARDTGLQYVTMLIGIDSNKMVITEIPTLEKLNKAGMRYEDIFYVAKPLNMKTLAGGKIYSFDTHVLGVYVDVSRMLFAGFPTNIKTRSLRREARYPCTLPCDAMFKGVKSTGVITNISQGGCQFRLPSAEYYDLLKQMRETGNYITLEVFFPFMDTPVDIAVTVKSMAREDAGMAVGAAFDGEPDAYVRAYLDSLHLESLNSFFN